MGYSPRAGKAHDVETATSIPDGEAFRSRRDRRRSRAALARCHGVYKFVLFVGLELGNRHEGLASPTQDRSVSDTYSPAAMDIEPAIMPATPAAKPHSKN